MYYSAKKRTELHSFRFYHERFRFQLSHNDPPAFRLTKHISCSILYIDEQDRWSLVNYNGPAQLRIIKLQVRVTSAAKETISGREGRFREWSDQTYTSTVHTRAAPYNALARGQIMRGKEEPRWYQVPVILVLTPDIRIRKKENAITRDGKEGAQQRTRRRWPNVTEHACYADPSTDENGCLSIDKGRRSLCLLAISQLPVLLRVDSLVRTSRSLNGHPDFFRSIL